MLIHSAVITGSVQFNNTDVSGITSVAGFASTGSNQFNGNQSISGSITSNGTITAQTLVVQTVTSSVEFITGSTRNGSLSSNTHQFTGSVLMTGSLSVVTTGTEFQVNDGGVNIGNALTDNHIISGSLRVNTNALFVSSSGNTGLGITSPASRLHVVGDITQQTSLNASAQFFIIARKSRGTVDVPLTVNVGDEAGGLMFQGYDGTTWKAGATIRGKIQAVSTASLSSNLEFFAGNGSPSVGSLVMTMRGDTQNVLIGTTTDTGFRLDVSGSTRLNGNTTVTGSIDVSGSITSNGTITAQTLVVQTVTSSVEFVTGSTRNGSLAENTHQFTGSVLMSGSVGIGTSSPTGKLAVNTGGSNQIAFFNNSTSGGTYNIISLNGSYSEGTNMSIQGGGVGDANLYVNSGYTSSTSGDIIFRNGGASIYTERMRITASGSIGIGTTSPTTLLHVNGTGKFGSDSVNGDLVITSNATPLILGGRTPYNRSFMALTWDITPDAGVILGNALKFNTGATIGTNVGTTAMTITTSGVKFAGGASSINYYEEGSWTPSIRGNGSFGTAAYQFRSGSYVRIGNYVFIRWGFKLSSFSGATGTMQITGLPFASLNWGSYQEPNISVSTGGLATADYAQRARVFVTSGGDVMEGRIANNSDTAWPVSEFNGDEWIIGEIFYNIA
jgi:hypothetical protein